MRRLASIRRVSEIFPIVGADAIEAARVDGWTCVVKKGEFATGDLGVYYEIDSFLPAEDSRYSFLEKSFIEVDGKRGARLRTMRLRGQLSQGLLLPISSFPELTEAVEGDDVTEALGITKWEPPIPANLSGEIAGAFPSKIRKTDQERIQNLVDEIAVNAGEEFEVTIKLDGTSMTVFRDATGGEVDFGVCGRNWRLHETETNSLWKAAREDRFEEALGEIGRSLAFQGELLGEGIQGNNEKLKGQGFYVFDIFDIERGEYLAPRERMSIIEELRGKGFAIKHVPILDDLTLSHTVEELLGMADGASLNPNEKREGLVFKRKDGGFSFKAISNWYLEKHGNR